MTVVFTPAATKMSDPRRNQLKKIMMSMEPSLRLQRGKTTSTAIEIEGNANNSPLESLRTLCTHGRLKEALHVLQVMDQRVDSLTYGCLLQSCINKKFLSEGKLVHSHMTERGFMPGRFLWNALLNMYVKCGSLADARKVFDQTPKRDVFSWNVMIAAYTRHGFAEKALILFRQMQRMGIQPDQFTFASVLPACIDLSDLKDVHEEIIRRDRLSDVFVGSALVDMYAKFGSIENARQVFDKIPQRDVVLWNAMITGYAQNRDVVEALKLFEKMPERDVASWNVMIAGYAQNGHVDEALKLFQEMPVKNVVSWNAMIAGYAQNGCVDEALKLFEKMPERNEVSWNALIAGCVQNGHGEKALELLGQMQLEGVRPNSKTFASILPACADLAALEQGMEIHEEISKSGFESDIFVMNALVDMYAKCGSIEKARDLFDNMQQRDVFSWTAMIAGYAMHGCGKEALKLFEHMQVCGINPNHVTLVCVLSACCHAGLVEEGWQYFDCMSRHYHITPAMEHYGCMVDLLCRAGRLDEAQDFINKMPLKPDATVWACLLGACRIHNNIELGEHTAEHVFELDPRSDTPYVLLSNIYAAAGRWDGIERLRRMMKDRNVKKMPGCSWIEVNKQVHAFLAGDM
eukprot:Gb_38245 [translate_table: standard]